MRGSPALTAAEPSVPPSEPATPSVAPPASPLDKLRFPAFVIATFDEGEEGSDGCRDSDSDGSVDVEAEAEERGDEAQRWRRYEEWRAAAGDDDVVSGGCSAPDAAEGAGGDEGEEEEEDEEGVSGGAAAEEPVAGRRRGGGSGWAGPGTSGPGGGWAGGTGVAVAGGRPARSTAGEPKRGRAAPGGRGGADGGGDAYEALPATTRYMLRWQAWLKRAEQPCIRYAYGLAPRWPVPPGDVLGGGAAGVPPCPCGRRRVFELQILPPILSLLAVDEHTAEAEEGAAGAGPASALAPLMTAGAAAATSVRKTTAGAGGGLDARGGGSSSAAAARGGARLLLGGGMDFSTVLIFSCPDSCAESSTEVAVVVPNR